MSLTIEQKIWIEKVLEPALQTGKKCYLSNNVDNQTNGDYRYYLHKKTKKIIFEKMVNDKWVKIN